MASSVADAAASMRSTGWLARLQAQFESGRHTDMVIRVRVNPEQEQEQAQHPPATKRRRTAAAATATATIDEHTDIKAHSVVLSAQSPYFDRCLGGDWAESAERRVEIEVPSEEALADLQLLVKLSYSDSFAHDEGTLLPLAVRMRLAVLADAYEFVDALQQLVESIPLELGFEGAIACLAELPAVVESHPSMKGVREQVAALLAEGIEERQGKADEAAVVEAAVDALAKCLGPVAGMFKKTGAYVDSMLSLRDDVQKLPLCVFKRLLASEALQLQSENETYGLLYVWFCESPHFPDCEAFEELACRLRYHHMTPDFLCSVVAECPMVEESHMVRWIMISAFAQRDAPTALIRHCFPLPPLPDRGLPPAQACWELETSFSLAQVAALREGHLGIVRTCGMAGGYRASVSIYRRGADGVSPATLGAVLRIAAQGSSVMGQEQLGRVRVGVPLRVELRVSPGTRKTIEHFFGRDGVSFGDVFEGKPWDELVREGSPHFPGGRLEVKASIRFLREWSP